MTAYTRREFLSTLAAAGLAGAATSWYADRLFAMVNAGALPAPRGPGVESWVPSLCRLCPAACGMRVRMVDTLPVGLEGNHNDPVSAGGLCPAGLAGLQELVHPDRLRTPVRRDGPRGATARWTPIGWDEAIERIAAPLRKLRAEGRPEAFAVLERGDSPLRGWWLERVMNAYGSPNLILDGTNETWRAAWVYVAGAERAPAVDLPNSDFILSFGHELFETDGHPVWQSKAWGQLRSPTVARPASLVYVGARISPSAARADRRIAIHPGSEGALVLGLIHVLLIEDLVDHRFIDRWLADYRAAGEDSGSSGDFESLVRHHHGPEEVSRVTGASVGDILRLGRAFGAAERPVAIVGPSPLHGPEGLATAMAVVALNLLVGAVGRPGGYVAAGRAPLTPPPAIPVDATGRRGLSAARVDGAGVESLPVIRHRPAGLVAALAERKPYPIEVLLMHGVNPTHEWPDGQRFASALANVPLVVATARVPDDTAALADLILPECSFLESSDLVPSIHGLPLDYVGLQQAAVRPLFESRPFEDIWFALARAIGHPVAGVIPPGSYADWLPQAAAGLREAGRGTLASGESDARLARFVEARGWRAQGPGSPDAFWAALAAGGAWVDTPAVDHSPAEVLGPGVDRFRLWPERLVREMTRLRGRAPGKEDFYAGAGSSPAAPPEAGRGDYPLDLLLFDVNTLWRGRTAVTPLLLELTGAREDIAWDSWVEIHPDTAARHGVRSGDRVRLESAIGGFAVRARVAPLVPPDAVAMPRGLGHRHFGRFASGVGANPAALVALRLDAWTGVAMLPTRVRLAAARV